MNRLKPTPYCNFIFQGCRPWLHALPIWKLGFHFVLCKDRMFNSTFRVFNSESIHEVGKTVFLSIVLLKCVDLEDSMVNFIC